MDYLTALSLEEIVRSILLMELWIAVIGGIIFFICLFVAGCREYDERFRYPKEWKKKDEEYKRKYGRYITGPKAKDQKNKRRYWNG